MDATAQREPEINKLFRLARHYQADLHLQAGSAPLLTIGGVTRESLLPPLSERDVDALLLPILYAEQKDRLNCGEEVAFTYSCEEGSAFLVTVSKRRDRLKLFAKHQGRI